MAPVLLGLAVLVVAFGGPQNRPNGEGTATPASQAPTAEAPALAAPGPSSLARPGKNPFARLQFTRPRQDADIREVAPRLHHEARVVCGMTIHEADPAVDPKFVRPVPPGDYKIRRIAPRVCRD